MHIRHKEQTGTPACAARSQDWLMAGPADFPLSGLSIHIATNCPGYHVMHGHNLIVSRTQNAPIRTPPESSLSLGFPEKTVFHSSVLTSGKVSSVRVSVS